ncbi:MAG: phospholipase D-like domain-containing protein [Parasphingopyxis sp.]|uniref:phospholipase D-like domain-containing protein n=1 Tax=Parasphingopyxis sp. TaxID=1920299 RepID=UPI003F9FE849
MNPETLFLRAGDEAVFPVRDGCRVTPLIDSAEMYPRLEERMLTAERTVWLAFRIFDPSTKLRSDAARGRGLTDWADLILDTVRRGVEVRLLLADFEPVMAEWLHAGAWSSFRRVQAIRPLLSAADQERLQIIVIQHVGEIGWFWRQLLRPALRGRVQRLVERLSRQLDEDANAFDVRPGLWRWLRWSGDRPSGWKPGPPPRLWPATYHQKCAVIDGRTAFIGGLDLDERRWDDSRHERPADETWHDLSAIVEGPAAGDAARNFLELWNAELPRFAEIVDQWTSDETPGIAVDPLDRIDVPDAAAPLDDAGATVQLLRTRSRHSASMFAFGPLPDIRELKSAHRKMIAAAKKRLYVEAQFFRSRDAADWAIAALRDNPALEIIVLIANVPEEIAFLGQGDNPAHRHGEYLQAKALTRILKAGGPERVGLFTMARDEAADRAEDRYSDSRGTAFGSGLIHIHAKLLIADDDACLISSANINGRSFHWDTELGFLWWQPDGAIAAFRRELWSRLSGGALADDAGLAEWRSLADHNRLAEPGDRKGFVIPYQRARARRFGRPHFYVPDSLV